MSLTPEQLVARRSLLTASETASAIGINPWHSPLDVYLEKMGEAPSTPDTWRSKRGHAVEPLILAAASAQLGLTIAPNGATLTHPILNWLAATPDGFATLATGERVAVVDAKEIGVRMAKDWQDDDGEFAPPDYVHVQLQVQMTVTKIRVAFACPWLPDEEEPRVLRVDHDPELEATILEELDRFRKHHVLRRIPPPARDEEEHRRLLARLFPRVYRKHLAEASLEQAEVMRSYLGAHQDKGACEMRKDHAANLLRAWIGDQEGIAGFGVAATWKEQQGKVDWESYARALGGNDVDAEKFRANSLRVLRVKEIKATKVA